MSTDPTRIPEFDELRIYDRAVKDYFSDITVDSKVVPVVIGTAARAFADVARLYGTDTKRIPLPVGNLLRGNLQKNMSRFMGANSMISSIPVDGKSLRTRRPYPVDIPYVLQFRAQTTEQSNILQKKLMFKIANERFIIPADIPGFNKQFNFFALASDIVNSFEASVGEGDKTHVISCTIVYEVYLFDEFSLHTFTNDIQTTWEVIT
jgi:hypothetical protein